MCIRDSWVELKVRYSNYHENIVDFLKKFKPPGVRWSPWLLPYQIIRKPLNCKYAYTATTGTWTLAHIDTFTLHSITLSFTFFIINWLTLTKVDIKLVKQVELGHETCANERSRSNCNRNIYDECRWTVGGTWGMIQKRLYFENMCKINENSYFRIQSVHFCRHHCHHFV